MNLTQLAGGEVHTTFMSVIRVFMSVAARSLSKFSKWISAVSHNYCAICHQSLPRLCKMPDGTSHPTPSSQHARRYKLQVSRYNHHVRRYNHHVRRCTHFIPSSPQ